MKDSSDRSDQMSDRVRQRARGYLTRAEGPGSPWIEVALVALVGVVLLYIVRSAWFFGDDWQMLTFRRELLHSGQWIQFLFNPHNEHLSTTVVVVFSVLESLFGIDSAIPFLVVVIIAHLALLWVVRCFLLRWGVSLIPRLFAIVWLGFLGSGAENLVWAFQAAYIGALALGLWGLYLVTGSSRSLRRNCVASMLFILSLFTAGTSLPVFAISMLVIIWNRRWRQLLEVGLAPAILYASWFLLYGASRQPQNPRSLTQIVPYMTRGLEFGLDQIVQFGVLGFILGIAAVMLLALTDWYTGDHRVTLVALILGAVAFFALGGWGRGFYGADQAQAVRYVYVLGAFAIPILIAVGYRVMQSHRLFAAVGFAFLAIAIIGNFGALLSFRNGRVELTDRFRAIFDATAVYLDEPLVDDGLQVEPTYNPDVTVARLRALRDEGYWTPDPTVNEMIGLEAAARLGIRTGAAAPVASSALGRLRIMAVDGATLSSGVDGCVAITPVGDAPSISLSEGRSGIISLSTGGRPSSMVIRSVATPSLQAGPVDLGTTGSTGPVRVAVFPAVGRPIIMVPATGITTLCGVDVP